MAHGHARDELGRVLPDCSWPADKAAPDELDVVRRFCNTCNHESGADRFETVEGVQRWLTDEGIAVDELGRAELAEIVGFREHVRAHAVAHHQGLDGGGLDEMLAEHVAEVCLGVTVVDGRIEVVPAGGSATAHAIATIAVAVMNAQQTGRWRRFKACPNCGWVFYDRSKNLSARWCSMNACGGRAKVAAFRKRTRLGTT